MENWLSVPTRRKPESLFPLKPKSIKPNFHRAEVRLKHVAARPGCDIHSRAEKAIAEAKRSLVHKSKVRSYHQEAMTRFEYRSDISPEELRQDYGMVTRLRLEPMDTCLQLAASHAILIAMLH